MMQMTHFPTLGRFDNQPNSSRLWGASCLYSPRIRERVCLESLEVPQIADSVLHFEVARVGTMREEAPLSPLCGTKTRGPDPSSAFPNSLEKRNSRKLRGTDIKK